MDPDQSNAQAAAYKSQKVTAAAAEGIITAWGVSFLPQEAPAVMRIIMDDDAGPAQRPPGARKAK